MSDESLAIFIPGQWAVIPASRETLERCAVLKIWRRFGPLNGDVSERFLLIVAAAPLHLDRCCWTVK
jgi:hypothetical protein